MDIKDILKTVDHTLLLQTSTWDEIKVICDDGMKYGVASVCIPPSFVKRVKEYVGEALKICTVIGFPNGYNTTEVKVFETRDAIQKRCRWNWYGNKYRNGKGKNYDYITNEIREIKEACEDKILKVIIETCLLTEEEKIVLCDCVTKAGADFIKTSTGFSNGGATIEDIELFKKYVGKDVKIKAAGGVKSIEKAEEFIEKGASRLGTSSIIKIMNNEEVKGY